SADTERPGGCASPCSRPAATGRGWPARWEPPGSAHDSARRRDRASAGRRRAYRGLRGLDPASLAWRRGRGVAQEHQAEAVQVVEQVGKLLDLPLGDPLVDDVM